MPLTVLAVLDPITVKVVLGIIGGLLMGFAMGYSFAVEEVRSEIDRLLEQLGTVGHEDLESSPEDRSV